MKRDIKISMYRVLLILIAPSPCNTLFELFVFSNYFLPSLVVMPYKGMKTGEIWTGQIMIWGIKLTYISLIDVKLGGVGQDSRGIIRPITRQDNFQTHSSLRLGE